MADGLLTLSSPAKLRDACDWARKHGPVGFVPTMGALHDGHLALVKEAKKQASFVVASVFVNPTQFGPNEDFSRYPRDIDGDRKKLEAAGCGLLFAPETKDVYPAGDEARVRVGALAETLEGEFRPGHFEGVATVVTKLFGMVGPCTAVFGRKDYQQLQVLKRVTKDLFLPVQIIGYKIVREADGVAMSSRNAYLSAADRERARGLSRGLSAAWKRFSAGEKSASAIREATFAEVTNVADSIDYVAVSDADTLQPSPEKIDARALVSIACRIGKTRLIDNVVLGEDPDPLSTT